MAAEAQRFDVATLRRMAGGTVFARGEDYHEDGKVEIASMSDREVTALVQGSAVYTAVLSGTATAFSGTCTCPAYSDRGFCKHLVATALAANAPAAGGGAPAEGNLERARRYLEGKDKAALVDMILALAMRNTDLLRSLDMAAATLGDDQTVLARYRKAIDEAVLIDDYLHDRDLPEWAEEAGAVLDRVAALVEDGRAGLARRLAVHAIDCLDDVMGSLDDSNGYCGGLLEQAAEIHHAACLAAPPDPIALAGDLFHRELESGWGTFRDSAGAYAEALGAAGMAEYRRLAEKAWASLPPAGRRDWEGNLARHRLTAILDGFAERDGDLERRIALRAAGLDTAWHYVELARFCREHGRDADALRWAEEGVWMFEDDRPDTQLVALAADLLTEAGRGDDAEALLWRTYERQHDPDLYHRLRALGGEAARDRAIALVRADLLDPDAGYAWSHPADGLVRLLMDEAMPDEAWAVVAEHRVSPGRVETLARATEATHPQQALAAYAERIDKLVEGGGDKPYREAHDLLARMAKLRDADAQAAHVSDLKQRFRRKRNFIKLLVG